MGADVDARWYNWRDWQKMHGSDLDIVLLVRSRTERDDISAEQLYSRVNLAIHRVS
jgi:hypothetical protein